MRLWAPLATRNCGAASVNAPDTTSPPAAPSPDLSPQRAGILAGLSRHLFDWQVYAQISNLETDDPQLAFLHFCDIGFDLDLAPAPLVDIRFVKTVGAGVGWPVGNVKDLLATLGAVGAGSTIGWSPRVVPAWIAAQLGLSQQAAAAMRFEDLLQMPRQPIALSPHPGLTATAWDAEHPTLADALAARVTDAALGANSILDLAQYPRQHADLARSLTAPAEVFDHAWSSGLRQNRLKYLGATAPNWMNHDQLLRNCVLTLYKAAIADRVMDGDKAADRIPDRPTDRFRGNPDTLRIARQFDPKTGENPPELEPLLELLPLVDSRAGFLAPVPGVEPVVRFAPVVHRPEAVLDSDVFTGRLRERTERVVYSMNLGLYDETPVPPQLDDCAYYLLTDAARVQPDLPWRIVRPTLSERDRKRLCLWYKSHPHLLFPEARHAIWIDGNIESLPGSEAILTAQEALAEVAAFAHPDRDCIYEEAEAIVNLGLDDPQVIEACVARMRSTEMPAHNGLFETNVLYTRPRDYAVARFLDRWWREIFLGSRRDQMSFTYAGFLTGVEISPLDSRHNAKTSRFFRKRPHRNAEGRLL